jgi:hypothetical protein
MMRLHGWSTFLMVLALVAAHAAARTTAEEFEVKAAFLLRFVDYVEWPVNDAMPAGGPMHVCVLGHDPFGQVLDALVRARSTTQRPIELHHVATARTASEQCHVVYVGRDDRAALRRDLGRLRDAPVLTVGEHVGFLDAGGIISLRTEDDRIRLAVSLRAAERAGLRISSRLLGVAQVVDAE